MDSFFFSLMLTGNSILLLILQQHIIEKEIVVLIFLGFVILIWICRVIITIILQWFGIYDLIFWIQLLVFLGITIILIIPFISIFF
ncbi:MAG: conserved membrane protein of unknown function [Promethearchaeota archaeon]|nr:MAG: conserved membrane protein of unknown function [Candidatus Lokiarchaeota archaeon]